MSTTNHHLKVAKIFETVSGEGIPSGEYSTFLRLSGCDFSCHFCDTDFKHKFSVKVVRGDSVYDNLLLSVIKTKHLVITGGEPILQIKALNYFIQKVFSLSKDITINIQSHGWGRDIKELRMFYNMLERNKERVVLTVSPKFHEMPSITNVGELYFVSLTLLKNFTGQKEFKLVGKDWFSSMGSLKVFLKNLHDVLSDDTVYSFQYEWQNDINLEYNIRDLRRWVEFIKDKMTTLNSSGLKTKMSFQLHKMLEVE